MSRQARLECSGAFCNISCLPGEIHKVTALAYFTGARGIERRKIFKDDKDRKAFLKRLAIILEETQTQCYVYPVKCLWNN